MQVKVVSRSRTNSGPLVSSQLWYHTCLDVISCNGALSNDLLAQRKAGDDQQAEANQDSPFHCMGVDWRG